MYTEFASDLKKSQKIKHDIAKRLILVSLEKDCHTPPGKIKAETVFFAKIYFHIQEKLS